MNPQSLFLQADAAWPAATAERTLQHLIARATGWRPWDVTSRHGG